jgi:FkbM family methyltransferase
LCRNRTDLSFQFIIARRFPWLRNILLRRLYRRRHIPLEKVYRSANGLHYLYEIDGVCYPNETLHGDVSFQHLLDKAKNESLHFYQPVQGDTVLDLGAGLGEEMVVLSRLVGSNGKVICIEANPEVFATLSELVRRNRPGNVMAAQYALAASNEPVYLRNPPGSYESGFLDTTKAGNVEVQGIKIDSLISKFGLNRIDLLKSNIEGAERFITLASPETMRKIRRVAIACHDFRLKDENNDFFRTRKPVEDFLLKNGFEIRSRNTGTDYLDDWVYGTNKFY